MKRVSKKWLMAVVVCAAWFGHDPSWATEGENGGVRLKIHSGEAGPTTTQPMQGMPMRRQGGMAMMQQDGMPMPMMQQCMQMHRQVLTRLEHLDQKIDHILKEREKESHKQLKEIEEKLEHLGKEIDHMFKEGEREAHERLSAIEKKLDHVLREQEQETH